MRTYIVAAALALVACGSGPLPPAPVTRLTAPADTVTLQDTDLGQGVWLGGDRWAVLASQAKTVRIVDFATHASRPLGRPGTDYREPYAIARVGDSLLVSDWGMRRLTAWGLAGALGSTVEAPTALRGTLPRTRDGAGAWYAELRPFPGIDGSGNLDSGAIVRWTGGATADTVARLAPFALERVTRDGASRYERLVFSGSDQWGIRTDGSFWIVRVDQNTYMTCGVPPAECTSGPRLRDKVLEVTAEDRRYFLQSYPPEHRALAEGVPYAIIKPPFDRAIVDAQGGIWLEQSRMLTDTLRSYRLLGPDGSPARELQLPNAQRILAISDTHVLAIDPLVPGPGHRVLRYVLPAAVVDAARH